jgi:polyferredoxin
MDKVERPRGLIRYSTDHAMENNFNSKQIRQRAMRPRVLIYTSILALIIIAVCTSLALRTPLKMDVIRDRGSMGREVEDGMIENVYRLQIMNTSEQTQHFKISASGLPGLTLLTREEVTLQPTETLGWPIRLRVPHGVGEKGSNKIAIELHSLDDPSLHVRESAVFIVPR